MLVPAFRIFASTAGTVLARIIDCIFFKSPPGSAWELHEAHRRDHGDRILAGLPRLVVYIQRKG